MAKRTLCALVGEQEGHVVAQHRHWAAVAMINDVVDFVLGFLHPWDLVMVGLLVALLYYAMSNLREAVMGKAIDEEVRHARAHAQPLGLGGMASPNWGQGKGSGSDAEEWTGRSFADHACPFLGRVGIEALRVHSRDPGWSWGRRRGAQLVACGQIARRSAHAHTTTCMSHTL